MAVWGMKNNNAVQQQGSGYTETSAGIWNLAPGGSVEIIIIFGGTGLEVAAAAEESWTSILTDLVFGDDFGLDTLLVWDNTSLFEGAPVIAAAPYTEVADALIIFPTTARDVTISWDLSPIGLGDTAPNVPTLNSALLAPYKPTVWNGAMYAMTQWKLTYRITNNEVTPGLTYIYYINTALADAYIAGTTGVFTPQPFVAYTGEISITGSPTVQAITDASGIYTLVAGQYHDELYQRIGTTSSTTINVTIPDPFFKTGYIGGS